MRIGIDARLLGYTQAGIGQYILRLTEGLTSIDSDDEFILLQSRKDSRIPFGKGRFQKRILWTPAHNRLEQFILPVEIAPLGLDVLHSPDFIPPFHRNCKSIITIHDLAFLLYPHFMTRDSARYYSQIDQAVRRTDHIIAVSESTKRDTAQLLGVDESKITVIHEAVHPNFQPVSDAQALAQVREKYGIRGDFILFVSTIQPRKNLPTLLLAYRHLLDDYSPDCQLVMVGKKGWLYEEVFTTAEQLRLQDKVLFLGRVPGEDIPLLYNAARVHVHPAYYEGFGLPALEAMACGTPTIVSNVSSLPEVVGDAGLLVEPDDVCGWAVAMWRALSDDELRTRMIEKGLCRAKLFSLEKMAEETMEVYRKVVG